MPRAIKSAFRLKQVSIEIEHLIPSRTLDARERTHAKYKQIASSIAAVGVIEPLVVFPVKGKTYRILDGHKRHDILLRVNAKRVDCIIAREDENYTYNRRANYLSPVSEHHMILKALEHNSEERIAGALNVDVGTIRAKRDLLTGVCKEAASVLKDHRVSPRAFGVLKRMKPLRQLEVAQMMVASATYSGRFAQALLAGTPDKMLVSPEREQSKKPPVPEQRLRLEQETDNLIREMKAAEDSYGTDVLTLTVSCRFVEKMLANGRVRAELTRNHLDLVSELDSLIQAVGAEYISATA
jgi:ParB-like chromosome segregation protein Spo0J